MAELTSLTLGKGEAYETRLSEIVTSTRTNQISQLQQTSVDNFALLTNVVTRHLLQGHIPLHGGNLQ